MKEEPIYNFQGLKNLLTRKGYRIGKAEPWRKIDSEEVSLRESNLEFSDEGIFLVDEGGIKRQVFLYKRAMYLKWGGVRKKPAFHVCLCEKIQEYLDGNDIPEYRRANTDTVRVLDKSNRMRETEVSNLPICGFCARILRQYKDLDSSVFAEILQKAASTDDEQPTGCEINLRTGYTKDWQEISTKIKDKHNWTCEKCGVQVSQFDHTFIEVHHKNKNKIDNRESNLQCLCIKCHSEVDATHVRNFSTPSQRLLIKLFLEKYSIH